MEDFRSNLPAQTDILIAEDSRTQAEQLRHQLAGQGYNVRVARNGREALAQARDKKPAILISDIVMPEMDGYALCKAIKGDSSIQDVPVILLTSLSGPQDVLKGLECGADNFIRKPYDTRYLLARIEYILANFRLRRAAHLETGIQLYFGGERYFITAEKQQILDLLISTYESAIQVNDELTTKQQELARERDLLHTLMDNVPDLICFKDIDSRFTTVNRAHAEVLCLSSPEDAIGKTDSDYFTGEYALEARADERRILSTGEPLIGKIERIQRPGGDPVWVSTTRMVMRDGAGSATGTFSVSRDITESKLAEEQIRKAKDELEMRVTERTFQLDSAYKQLERELIERERAQKVERETQVRFRYLFANNPLPMWVYDLETLRFLEVNDAAATHYGYSANEFAALRITDLHPPDEAEAADVGKTRQRVRDGRIIDVDITWHAIDWLGRKAALVVAQDITEQKRLQRAFVLAQKMEAIGTLAAGVAHDFNNLLTVVNGYANFVLEQLNAGDPHYEEVSEILRAGERAAALTRQLLAFSRRKMFQARVINLNETVADMERMLHRLIGADIILVTKLDPTLAHIKADSGQMEQVVMNLAVNARDAMPTGGKLTIETSNISVSDGPAAADQDQVAPGQYVLLSVSDTGTGMDAATRTRIFEPFFTTKDPGKGTGLGLSTVFGIIEQFGGAIVVDSELGRGTTFKIYLPQVSAVEQDSASTAGVAHMDGNETVLVVEDEDGVRTLECCVLETKGYRVLHASTGPEAIILSEHYTANIDLLLTDMVMPGMNGRELAEYLTTTRPGLKVLFTSGYMDESMLVDDMQFLAKPFEGVMLARKVRDVLDGLRGDLVGRAG